MTLKMLVNYLDEYLNIDEIPDSLQAYNGLQVEGSETVESVALAVDACQYTIDKAGDLGADLLLVHHGLFWSPPAPMTGTTYKRIHSITDHSLAIYSAHIPLDAHKEVGNNAVLASKLGIAAKGMFCQFEGLEIGVWGELSVSLDELVDRVSEVVGVTPTVLPGGPDRVEKVGVVTGGAGTEIAQAAERGLDAFVTGEGPHHTFFDAEELGVTAIFAGHYATEVFGVQILGDHLAERFGLSVHFIDHPTGL
jgi:dinuclear metal center YbgI/SA1388 family protein